MSVDDRVGGVTDNSGRAAAVKALVGTMSMAISRALVEVPDESGDDVMLEYVKLTASSLVAVVYALTGVVYDVGELKAKAPGALLSVDYCAGTRERVELFDSVLAICRRMVIIAPTAVLVERSIDVLSRATSIAILLHQIDGRNPANIAHMAMAARRGLTTA